MQRKIRFSLKFNKNLLIYDMDDFNNNKIDLDILLNYFEKGILQKWMKLNDEEDYSNKLNEIKGISNKNERIYQLGELFDIPKEDIEDYINSLDVSNNSDTKIENSIVHNLGDKYKEYEYNKNNIFEKFKVNKVLSFASVKQLKTSLIQEFKHIEGVKKDFYNLNESLKYWKDVKIIEKDFINSLESLEKIGVQPIIYYYMLLDEHEELKRIVIENFSDQIQKNLSSNDSNKKEFIVYYNDFFKKFENIVVNSTNEINNVILLNSKGFSIETIKDNNSSEQLTFQEYKKIKFKPEPNNTNNSIIFLKVDELRKVF